MVKAHGKHYHNRLTESEIKIKTVAQQLKKEVSKNNDRNILACNKEAESQLIRENIPERIIAANFQSYSKISLTQQKRRAKKQPSLPSDFTKLVLNGDFVLSEKNQNFYVMTITPKRTEFCYLKTTLTQKENQKGLH